MSIYCNLLATRRMNDHDRDHHGEDHEDGEDDDDDDLADGGS